MADPAGADVATASPDSLHPGEIRQQASVQEALKESAPATAAWERRHRPIPRAWAAGVLAVALAVLYYLLDSGTLPTLAGQRWIPKAVLAALLMSALLALHAIAAAVVVPRFQHRAARHNVRRVLKLLVALVIAFSVISVLFVGWYGAALSFGLVSLILGFALQTPITSFFAWIFILVRSPYRVGDRIRIGEATGDVIDVGYLDTTLWEFGGGFSRPITRAAASSASPTRRCSTTPSSTTRGRCFRTSGTRSRSRWPTRATWSSWRPS